MLKKIPYCLFCIFFTFLSQIAPLNGYGHSSQILNPYSEKSTYLKTLSTITNLAQTAIWLNEEKLAVGRWDGTITIFHCEDSLSILQAVVPPVKQGITMMERIHDFVFVSSNGLSSIALWEQNDEGYCLKNTYHFNTCFGSVDSARFLTIGQRQILLTGHSEGYLLIWEFSNNNLSLLSSINLQSNHPIDSPYKLWNVRSILSWKDGLVVTASEDGDLCMINVLESKIVHRQTYNENAKRGINHIFISGDYLLLANCSVGSSDNNLWLYRIEKKQFTYLDSKNLLSDKNLEQVFSFDVGCICHKDNLYFLCSTGEGLVWLGQIKNESLHILNSTKVSHHGGAALAINPQNQRIASVCYDIHLLEVDDH